MNFFRAIINLFRFDRTNWKALALSFLAAAVFWLFNALNKTNTTNLRFPIEFAYDRNKFIPVEPLPASLVINVNGNGWELLRKSLGFKLPGVSYPLEHPAETRKIAGSSLSPLVAGLISPMQVNYVVTDTLRLHFETLSVRRVKLVADDKEITFKQNFARTGQIRVSPDSVTLKGPKSIIEKLPDSLVLVLHGSRVSSPFKESVEVETEGRELVNRSPPVADVSFEVKPVRDVMRRFKVVGQKSAALSEIGQDSVDAHFRIPEEFLDQFMIDSIVVQIQVPSTLRKGEKQLVMPLLHGVPGYAKVLSIDSVTVRRN